MTVLPRNVTRENLHTSGHHAPKKTGAGRKSTFRCVSVCVCVCVCGRRGTRVSVVVLTQSSALTGRYKVVLCSYYGLRYIDNFKDFYEHVINDKRRKILILALASCVTIKNHSNLKKKSAFNKIVIINANMLISNTMAQLCLATSYCANTEIRR